MTLTFDLNINIFTMNLSLAKCLCSDKGIQNLGIWMRQHVVYILDLSMTLTFDLHVGGGGILTVIHFENGRHGSSGPLLIRTMSPKPKKLVQILFHKEESDITTSR